MATHPTNLAARVSRPACARRPAGGFALIYAAVAIVVMMGFISFAVDLGRVQCAKTELQNACDAAARYAATGLSDSSTLTKAQSAAAENRVDGSALSLQASDVQTGQWNSTTKVFTPGGGSPNAIRIQGKRTAARGNAVPLWFARILGRNQIDLTAESIAMFTGAPSSAPSPGVAGLNGVSVSGGCVIRRWSGESGGLTVASNGAYSLTNGTYINGDVLYRTAPGNWHSGITGSKTQMTSDIAYANAVAPGGAGSLGNYAPNWQGDTRPAGNYTATGISIGGGTTVNITGNVNIYSSGDVTIGGGSTINTNGTSNKLTIYVTNASTVNINMSSTFYLRIYAPQSTVNLTGSSPMVGSVVAKNLNLTGSANLNYSAALSIPVTATGGGGGGGESGSGGTVSMVE